MRLFFLSLGIQLALYGVETFSGEYKMGKSFGFIPVLLAILLFFDGLSFGGQLEKEILVTDSPNEMKYGQWISRRNGEAYGASLGKALSRDILFVVPAKNIENRESSMKSEITNIAPETATAEIRKKDLPYFENGSLSKRKSRLDLSEIHLTKTSPDSSLDFISGLSAAQHKEENPLPWPLERIKENDIFKSLGFFLKLKLTF